MDALDEIEFRNDTRASFTAALSVVREVQWEVKKQREENAVRGFAPGWEPFAVSKGYIFYRRPKFADE
jgi:hypothetical protein